jgi:hypothetical protein
MHFAKTIPGLRVAGNRAHVARWASKWGVNRGGKIRPNLVSSRMIWDADVCPEGLGENFMWHFEDTGAHGPTGDDKNGKESKMARSIRWKFPGRL